MMKISSDAPTNLTASPATPVMEQPMKRDDERTLAQRGEDAAQMPQRAQAAPMVRFLGVTKRYGALTVLDELDLDVAPNKKVAIIGPSGSGKSTLLRVLMTLDPLTSGMIEVDGEPLTHMRSGGKLVPASPRHVRAVRSKIGMVFQSFNLFPHMTALQNTIEAPIHSLGLARNEAVERARELLSLVGLADKCNHYPSQLSGGQQQRVAIARALAMRPKVMLFDEVTSALDPELCGEVLNVIRRLGEEHNLTMLMVTHQMGFAKDFADRVCFFSQGKIVEQGPPREFFSAPKHERTQQFLRAVREAL
jgi:polar amino acid transport system ATP-binding protein